MSTLLEARGVAAGYHGPDILQGLDCTIAPGEIVTLIGHNGAGKSTLLKTLFGVLPLRHGNLTWRGQALRLRSGRDAARAGLRLVPEGTPVFADLSVADNLAIGATAAGHRRPSAAATDLVNTLFPRLLERRGQIAGTMSGGERKMLGIAMALLTQPALLLLDEPSIGLAPALVQDLFARIARIRQDAGLSILLVEQNVRRALEIADRVYVMKLGRIVRHCPAAELGESIDLMELF